LLGVANLSSGYENATIIRDVSLHVPSGSIVALLGPNGAGKTTLLRTIAGLIRPTLGTVSLAGQDITTARPHERVRDGLCYIPEGRGIFASLTVKANLSLQAKVGREEEMLERASALFPVLGTRMSQLAGTLSGGEQQMLALARACAREPRLILVDEPSLGLAPTIVDEIFAFLEGVRAMGASLLIVDQFVTRALELASTAYVLRRGEIAFSGTSATLLEADVFEQYLGVNE
jgi:branched-chain amino acid transport system ATP-binding protein